MATPNAPLTQDVVRRMLEDWRTTFRTYSLWDMLAQTQDDLGAPTVHYHRGRYFYVTPSHFFFAHHEPSPSDCTWIVPGTYGRKERPDYEFYART